MSRYEGTFEDYLEMFIQFGYVTLFSSAFPLAAMCAFLNNLIEIRSDAFKLCCVFQRPFGHRAQSIGVWQDAMELMGVLGIMVNCMLIGLSGQVHRMFPEMSTAHTILLIIVLEHAMIALKYGISYVIPDIPAWVATEMAKVEFQRREALRRLSTSNSPPTREESQSPSPRYLFGHSITSTTEYVDRSAQTDLMYSRRRSFKTSPASTIDEDEVLSPTDVEPETRSVASDAAATEARAAAATAGSERDGRKEDDLRMRELESFEGAKARPIVRLGRSVSACERVHHRVPRIHRIMNQESAESNDSEEDLLAKPFDSLPLLSAPATMDNKNRLFRFSPDNERVLGGMKPAVRASREAGLLVRDAAVVALRRVRVGHGGADPLLGRLAEPHQRGGRGHARAEQQVAHAPGGGAEGGRHAPRPLARADAVPEQGGGQGGPRAPQAPHEVPEARAEPLVRVQAHQAREEEEGHPRRLRGAAHDGGAAGRDGARAPREARGHRGHPDAAVALQLQLLRRLGAPASLLPRRRGLVLGGPTAAFRGRRNCTVLVASLDV
ncbi:Anoctamin-8 [Penaeus vannamei]|uniref:Anoctamin n=1 Tax=Penaeus vannamei TaxID=6689 RepID=A0A3R7PVX2_PENVA|nr:Anoctamin-8 [Penaeus vannamei]